MDEDQAADNSSCGDEDYFDADPQPQMGPDGDTSGQSSDDVFLKLAQDGPESTRNNSNVGYLERKSVSLVTISPTDPRFRWDMSKEYH